ncbi:MAG: hypothetical protein EPGJADBJ_05264 [Saprospiraceae bacterium]|nr:hypothetical protein [Saprospiraceae bacterium]
MRFRTALKIISRRLTQIISRRLTQIKIKNLRNARLSLAYLVKVKKQVLIFLTTVSFRGTRNLVKSN